VDPKVINAMVRDFGSTLAGLGILVHQTVMAKEPHGILLATALVLLSVPSATGLLSLFLGGKSNTGEATPVQQSSSPQP
jgi:hypothetical protein